MPSETKKKGRPKTRIELMEDDINQKSSILVLQSALANLVKKSQCDKIKSKEVKHEKLNKSSVYDSKDGREKESPVSPKKPKRKGYRTTIHRIN